MNWLKSFWKSLNTPMPHEGIVMDDTMVNFTPRAQQVLVLARREADRFRHHFVGTEHLLLGLIRLGQGTAFTALERMGLDLTSVRQEIETQVGAGPDQKLFGTPFTPRARHVLALAAKEAQSLNHPYVGTEHILLGLLGEGDGVAGRVLRNRAVDIYATRQQILEVLDPNSSRTPERKSMPQKLEIQNSSPEEVDITRRYDVYCWEGDQTTVYRNALFKGTTTLLQTEDYDLAAHYIELEQADGRTVFIARSSLIKFCEHGTDPASQGSGRAP
jgi:ATP-dependent Clp protease ATP-binding subunit ClpA